MISEKSFSSADDDSNNMEMYYNSIISEIIKNI